MKRSPLTELAQTLEKLPRYLLEYFFGLVINVCQDVLMTSLLIGCVLLALLTGPLVGLVVFFLAYTGLGTMTNVSLTIHQVGIRVAQGLISTNRTYPVHPPIPEPDSSV